MNVRRVPISGMNSSAEENVPSSEPTVEIAYRRPETVPACATSPTARRSA